MLKPLGGVFKYLNDSDEIIIDRINSECSIKNIFTKISFIVLHDAVKNKKNEIHDIEIYYKNQNFIVDCALVYQGEYIHFLLFNYRFKEKSNLNKGFIYDPKNQKFRFKTLGYNELLESFEPKSKGQYIKKINSFIKQRFPKERNDRLNISVELVDNRYIHLELFFHYVNERIIIVLVHDITKEYNNILKVSEAEKYRTIGQMAGGMAHVINNQLMVILGATELLSPTNNISNEKYIKTIKETVKKSSKLINQLLTFSKPNFYYDKYIDLVKVFSEVKETTLKEISEDIKTVWNYNSSIKNIKGDASSISSALLNVIRNSCESYDKEEKYLVVYLEDAYLKELPEGAINYGNIPYGKYLKISIIDNGCGIKESNIVKVCEPFFTTKWLEVNPGLGLSATLGTITSHNGFLAIRSCYGFGTMVNIFIKADEEMEQLNLDFKVTTSKVIVIDDDPVVCSIVSELVKSLDYDVISFNNPIIALDYYREHYRQISVIICDMLMPQMNGQEVFEETRKIDTNLAFFILSGYTDLELDVDFISSITGRLNKPVSLEDLQRILELYAK